MNDSSERPWEKIDNDINTWKKDLDGIMDEIKSDELTRAFTINDVYRMSILIAAASYCEQRLISTLTKMYEKQTNSRYLSEFVRKRALERQYHSLFDWTVKDKFEKGARMFYSMFGNDLKIRMTAHCNEDEEFRDAQSAFVELGALRNKFAHEGSLADSTYSVDEVISLFNNAKIFFDKFFAELERQPDAD